MIHMTHRSTFDSVKTKVEKSGGNIQRLLLLSSALDQLAVLGQLGGHGHVHEFICNAHLEKMESAGKKILSRHGQESSDSYVLQLTTMPPTIVASTA